MTVMRSPVASGSLRRVAIVLGFVEFIAVHARSPFLKLDYTSATNACEGGLHFRGECYTVSQNGLRWEQASKMCSQGAGRLVIPEKNPVINFLNKTLSDEGIYWIGMMDYDNSARNLRWLDGRAVDKGFLRTFGAELHSEDPAPSNTTQSTCAALRRAAASDSLLLERRPCSASHRYICQQMTSDDPIAVRQINDLEDSMRRKEELSKKDIFNQIIKINQDAGVLDSMYQGDIRLSRHQAEVWRAGGDPWASRAASSAAGSETRSANLGFGKLTKRGASNNQDWIWPKGEIIYEFNTATQTSNNMKLIRNGMDGIESKTCVRFVERTTEDTYITITAATGCSSQVGMYPGETYEVMLGPECTDELGRMQHELLHAIGFYHEQARHDRDDWVQIHLNNVIQGRERNFDKMTTHNTDNLGHDYDYDSVMHYGAYAFSRDLVAGLQTISTLRPPGADIGQRNRMSDTDVAQINRLYNCQIAIDGGWGPWQSWGGCSATCGGGSMSRSRQCNNPTPSNGGKTCGGSATESQQCMTSDCPLPTLAYSYLGCWKDEGLPEILRSIEGQPPYLDDSYLTRSDKIQKCANSAKNANVVIFGLRFGGKCLVLDVTEDPSLYRSAGPSGLCTDGTGLTSAMDVYTLNTGPVAGQWGTWGSFGTCSDACGPGTRTRSRSCNNPTPSGGGANCQGAATDDEACNLQTCPVDGGWSAWGVWGACSVSCGAGTRVRSHTCDNPVPAHGGFPCRGASSEGGACTAGTCLVDGDWSAWGSAGTCSRPCGSGTATRTRTCTNPAPANGGTPCSGDTTKTEPCNTQLCAVDGAWSAWSVGGCDRSCGSGTRTKTRTCTNPTPVGTGRSCSGGYTQTEDCNTQDCPVDGGWAGWTQYGTCSKSCESGQQTRTRHCTQPSPANGGQTCSGGDSETRACNTSPCPVDGGWSEWAQEGSCSATCGSGVLTSSRKCDNPAPAFGGGSCNGGPTRTTACTSPTTCPGRVDGAWSVWSAYTTCSASCGGGTQLRTRSCADPAPSNGGTECEGDATETADCNTHYCSVHGGWSDWGLPSPCSEPCESGDRTRDRTCTDPSPAHGGDPCAGESTMSEVCNTHDCGAVVHGGWSAWVEGSPCSDKCLLTLKRSCTNPEPYNGGGNCDGSSVMVTACNPGSCPLDGAWGPWGKASPCSSSCGQGSRTRTRSCDSPPPEDGGRTCTGVYLLYEACYGACEHTTSPRPTTPPVVDAETNGGHSISDRITTWLRQVMALLTAIIMSLVQNN